MNNVFFHIGYPKTGTTWMQVELFPKLDLNYLGKRYGRFNKEKRPKHNFYGKKINQILSLAKKAHGGGHLLVSEEGLLSDADPDVVAKKIKKDTPDAKVIISIRNQSDILQSRVNHNSRRFYLHNDIKKIYNYTKKHKDIEKGSNIFKYYNYNRTYDIFVKKFGKMNVHVLVYEALFFDESKELHRLVDFLDVNMPDCNLEKIKNKKYNANLKKKKLKGFDKKTIGLIKKEFKKSNNLLSKKININLSEYGY